MARHWPPGSSTGVRRSCSRAKRRSLFTEDDLLWYLLKPTPDSHARLHPGDQIIAFAEQNGQLGTRRHLVWDEGFGDGWTDDDLWGLSEKPARRAAVRHRSSDVINGTAVRCRVDRVQRGDRPRRQSRHGLRTDVPWSNTIGPRVRLARFQSRTDRPRRTSGAQRVRLRDGQPVRRPRRRQAERDAQRRSTSCSARVCRSTPSESRRTCSPTSSPSGSTQAAIGTFLREVADRGLKILITEMDVLDDGLPADRRRRDRMSPTSTGATSTSRSTSRRSRP